MQLSVNVTVCYFVLLSVSVCYRTQPNQYVTALLYAAMRNSVETYVSSNN